MCSRKASTPPRSIMTEDHFIDALDSGVRLHLREKRPGGLRHPDPASTLLFVHGQSIPAPIAFDFPLPGYSWMEFAAARGFDVFALSVRGYGLSTRPPELEESPLGNPPAIRGLTAVRDIEAAVRFICENRRVDRLNLLGWSWGTTTAAAYAAAHGARVIRLVLFAPFYAYDSPEAAAQFEDPRRPGRLDPRMGAWRWVTERVQRERWDGSIPRGKHARWREERATKLFWTEQLRYDPQGRRRRPPAVRVPNGAMADRYDRARNIPLYDAARVRCPILLIRGDHDRSSLDPEASGLFRALTRSPGKRYIVLGDATHFLQFERRRIELFKETQLFLEL